MPSMLVTERRPGTVLQIGTWPTVADEARAALAELLTMPMPLRPGATATRGSLTVVAPAPGRWLLVDETPWPAARLGALAAREVLVVTDLSDARAVLRVEGPGAPAVLRQGPRIDLDPRAFPPGAARACSIHTMSVLIYRIATDAFDLHVALSHTHAIREWLTDAATESGR
jgi:heterotetrameric sarcosine oxidase gamma subunit